MNPILNPANPASPLSPLNPVHRSSNHTTNTVDTVTETAVPDSTVVVGQQTDNGALAAFLFLGILIGFTMGALWCRCRG